MVSAPRFLFAVQEFKEYWTAHQLKPADMKQVCHGGADILRGLIRTSGLAGLGWCPRLLGDAASPPPNCLACAHALTLAARWVLAHLCDEQYGTAV